MDIFFEWLAVLGSWSLFAGAIWQAALELREQDIKREQMDEMQGKVAKPDPISAYWWFFPPAKIYLETKRSHAYREAFLQALPDETVEGFVNFMNKATGWVLVAVGGLLLAARESFNLLKDDYHLSLWWFLLAIIILAFLSLEYTVVSIRRSDRMKTVAKKK